MTTQDSLVKKAGRPSVETCQGLDQVTESAQTAQLISSRSNGVIGDVCWPSDDINPEGLLTNHSIAGLLL